MDKNKVHTSKAASPGFSRLMKLLCNKIEPMELARSQASPDWLERAAVARHPKSPINVLSNLAKDGNLIVRQLAEDSLSRKQDAYK